MAEATFNVVGKEMILNCDIHLHTSAHLIGSPWSKAPYLSANIRWHSKSP
jgi:hypothetical protein